MTESNCRERRKGKSSHKKGTCNLCCAVVVELKELDNESGVSLSAIRTQVDDNYGYHVQKGTEIEPIIHFLLQAAVAFGTVDTFKDENGTDRYRLKHGETILLPMVKKGPLAKRGALVKKGLKWKDLEAVLSYMLHVAKLFGSVKSVRDIVGKEKYSLTHNTMDLLPVWRKKESKKKYSYC